MPVSSKSRPQKLPGKLVKKSSRVSKVAVGKPKPTKPVASDEDGTEEDSEPEVNDVPALKTKTPKPSARQTSRSVKDQEPDEDEEAGDEDDDNYLQGFSSEADSSDEEGVDTAPVDVGKLPTIAKDDATIKRRLEKAKQKATEEKGVIYLGRIPHGFYEDQMKAYFSQFGDITRLRLSRSKKTGKSKHYAFIEFLSAEVAEVVADTMDNYLLMGHILRCRIIPKDEVHPELWVGANRKWRVVPRDRIARVQQNKERTEDEKKKVGKRILKRQNEKKRKLEAAGIDYDLDGVAYSKPRSS